MKIRYLLLMLSLITGSYSLSVQAAGDHHEDHQHEADNHEEEAAKEGPNGGRLLTEGDFALEITIFESGIPPEMRIYAYQAGKPLDPAQVAIEVRLDRLGGAQDSLRFSAERDYLVGDLEVYEPHSFDVSVKANYRSKEYRWSYDNYEGRAEISDRLLALAGVKTEPAGTQQMTFKDTLFGVIAAPEDQVFRIDAPYAGIVDRVHVQVGDSVKKGQLLVTVRNTKTLQRYSINSPADGEVTARMANRGDRADGAGLLKVTDLSNVWVEMSAFPENIEKLAEGQPVTVYDLHQHERSQGLISYVAPVMTGGHIARARAVIDNPDGHWRPGMHIKADIQTDQRQAPLAVRLSALQSFRDMPVVFAKFGNLFEVRMVELGDNDGEFVEVLGGLKPGTEYVTVNSFLLKADVLKDGASHDH